MKTEFAIILAILLTPGLVHGQQPMGSVAPTPEQALSEIKAYLAQVGDVKVAANKAFDSLDRKSEKGSYAKEWLATVAPKRTESVALFVEAQSILEKWAAAVETHSDPYPPLRDIRLAVSAWRKDSDRLISLLNEARQLEISRQWTEEPSDREKPSPEVVRAREAVRTKLADAQTTLESSVKIPAPYLRSASPFDGPVNPGRPDRLWIWMQQASTMIGDSLETEVGLGNRLGPNCVADQKYVVINQCDGCTINLPEITLRKGDRRVRARVQTNSSRASVIARTDKLKQALASFCGCKWAQAISLKADRVRSVGRADGLDRIPLQLVFVDDKNELATNGERKHVSRTLNGVGQIESLDRFVASVPAGNDIVVIPTGECCSSQGVFSNYVGHTTVSLEFQNTRLPLEFTFNYAFPKTDIIAWLIGAVLAFFSRFIPPKTKLPWPWVIFSSLLGASVGFAWCYQHALSKETNQNTWIVVGLYSLVAGTLGVGVLKLVGGPLFQKVA